MMLLSDQHEHLGQSIAYARSNGVVSALVEVTRGAFFSEGLRPSARFR